jgi:hypothetical protein
MNSLISQASGLIKEDNFPCAVNIIKNTIDLSDNKFKAFRSLMQKAENLIRRNDYENTRKNLNDILFELAYLQMRAPKRKGYPSISAPRIFRDLKKSGFLLENYLINIKGYHEYIGRSRYAERFPGYFPDNVSQKSLEHYLAAKLLDVNEKDIYIDIASEGSPAPFLYRELFGAKTFRQDLIYAPGFNGDQIGGDAARMEIPDEFATKMALHCSFEHFEGNSDIGFIHEAYRILKPGGSVCIVPLYLADEYCIVTDPVTAAIQNTEFEDSAMVCCVKGHNAPFGRFYDPANLKSRIQSNLGNFSLTIYRITNPRFDPSCCVHFTALLQKPNVF